MPWIIRGHLQRSMQTDFGLSSPIRTDKTVFTQYFRNCVSHNNWMSFSFESQIMRSHVDFDVCIAFCYSPPPLFFEESNHDNKLCLSNCQTLLKIKMRQNKVEFGLKLGNNVHKWTWNSHGFIFQGKLHLTFTGIEPGNSCMLSI